MKALFLLLLISSLCWADSVILTAAKLSQSVYDKQFPEDIHIIHEHHNPLYGNYLIIALDKHGRYYVVVRGSHNLANWISNLHLTDALLSPIANWFNQLQNYQKLQQYHQQWFQEVFADLKNSISPFLKKDHANRAWVFTGHSYGGLMAHLLAQDAHGKYPQIHFQVHTFNAPGTQAVRQHTLNMPMLRKEVSDRFLNHIHECDLVSSLINTHEGNRHIYQSQHPCNSIADHSIDTMLQLLKKQDL